MALATHMTASASLATLQLPRESLQLPFLNPISAKYEGSNQSSKILAPEIRCERSNGALQVFEELPVRFDNRSSSSAVFSSARAGCFFQNLDSFERMLLEGSRLNGFMLRTLLEECKELEETKLGKQIHSLAIRGGFGVDVGVRIALINMYSDLGMLSDSRRIFYEISTASLNNGHLWHAMISAYISHGYFHGAFMLYYEMLSLGFDKLMMMSTHVSIISACWSSREERFGMVIHGRIIKDEELVGDTSLLNCLFTFCGKCRKLEYASRLFEGIYNKDVVSWNAIISAHEQNRSDDGAIDMFRRMISDDPFVHPNRITFLSILGSISKLGSLRLGKEIHGFIIRSGFAIDTSICNALITMYSRWGEIGKAETTFEVTLHKDLITWNSMLVAFEQNGLQEKCFGLFERMQISEVKPDDHSFTIICSAVALEAPLRRLRVTRAREIHGHVLRRCSAERIGTSVPVCNAILKMYSKFGCTEYARKFFDGMRHRDSYSWNAMIDGYSRNRQFEDAFRIYREMLELDLAIDHFTYSILLTLCGSSASLHLGKQLHSITLKNLERLGTDALLSITNALVSMYSKCGSIGDASEVFSKMETRDVISWTAMITAYAEHGMVIESIELFESMKEAAVEPNEVTFLGLLVACSHGGLIDMGAVYFHLMSEDYGMSPTVEQYASMVDLYGRAGHLDWARECIESAISNTTLYPNEEVKLWKVLLSSCHAQKELAAGVEAATRVLELDPEDE